MSTSCITSLSFLANTEEGDPDNLSSSVKEYLEKELQKPFLRAPHSLKQSIRRKQSGFRSRKSGIAGIIKRTRSIQVDQYDPDLAILRAEYNGKPGPLEDLPSIVSTPSRENSEEKSSPASPGVPEHEDETVSTFPLIPGSEQRIKAMTDSNSTDDDLLAFYKDTEHLEDQGDVLHYLAYSKGLGWDTHMGSNSKVTVKDLLKELYEKACHEKKWALVRHIAGILGKRVEDLAKAVADLLVRQKQVTIGMPPNHEKTITRPIPSKEIREMINEAHGGDQSTAMLSQELLVYLAMYIRTEPQLFCEMLRLRVGLIIQVSASELGRALKCSGEEASEHLLNLSPYEMKMLLHHILSGKEFSVKGGKCNILLFLLGQCLLLFFLLIARSGHVSLASEKISRKSNLDTFIGKEPSITEEILENDRQGQWLRRRRLDGALNRVPKYFYPKIWALLEKVNKRDKCIY